MPRLALAGSFLEFPRVSRRCSDPTDSPSPDGSKTARLVSYRGIIIVLPQEQLLVNSKLLYFEEYWWIISCF